MHSGSVTHTRNRLAFAPLRGVATRESSAASSRYRTYEGVAPLASPRRAHERRRAGCLQPECSGPFVLATAPSLSPCGPGSSLQCSGNRSHPVNHSLIISVPPRRSTTSARPPRNGLAVLRKEKWVWRLETCDGAFDFAPPHSAAGPCLDQLQTPRLR